MISTRNYLLCTCVSVLFISPLVISDSSSGSYSAHKNVDKDLVTSPSAYAKQVKRDDQPKFSIGLGTLSPSYQQKLGPDGKTQLDFNTDKNGFSYSISNANHQTSLTQSGTENKASKEHGQDQNLKNHNLNPYNYYQGPTAPNVNVYHQQGYSAYPQQLNALAQMYGANAAAGAGYNGQQQQQAAVPGMLPFVNPGAPQTGQYLPTGLAAYPGNGFGFGQGFTSNVAPNQGNIAPTTAATSTKPEAKEDSKTTTESTSHSSTSGQLNTIPGGIFNYGFSQNHGLPQGAGVNYPVNQMNYPGNPFALAAGGQPGATGTMNGVTQTAINHGAAAPGVGQGLSQGVPGGSGSMYGSPYAGYGMDPFSMAAMSGYGGGPGADAYSGGYGGYGAGSGMMGSASSPYASLFPFL